MRRICRLPVVLSGAFVLLLPWTLGSFAEAGPVKVKTVADAQCMVVGARLAESPNPRLRFSGEMLLSYFLGRIDGRSPKVDLEALVKREGSEMMASSFRRWAHRCGAEFSARGAEITRIGKDLERSGK